MRPALVLIDLQRDYLDRVGLLPVEAELVANVAKLLNLCRQYSVPVFHVMTLVHADGSNRMPHWVKQHRWDCLAGTPGARLSAGALTREWRIWSWSGDCPGNCAKTCRADLSG